MIITGQLVRPQEERSVSVESGWIKIQDDKIVELRTDGVHPDPDLGGEDYVILPGFVDCHLHLPQFDVIGLHGLPLLQWLEATVFPAEAKWSDPEYAALATAAAIKQLFSVGTTSFVGFGTVHAEAVNAALSTCESHRIRSRVGVVLMNQQCPAYLARPTDEQLSDAQSIVEEWPDSIDAPSPVVAASLAPRFAISCSSELMSGAGRIAQGSSVIIQTHLSETEAEVAEVARLHNNCKDYVTVYEKAGLLGPRSLLAHGIWLSESEQACLKGHDAVIAHCPVANSFLRSGTMNRANHLKAGLRVALGSDIGGGYHRSMVRVAQEMISAAAILGNEPTNTAEAWWQITLGNADTLGWTNVGRIELDAEASFVVAKPDITWRNFPDPLGALLFAWDDRWIDSTISLGKSVYQR